MHRITAHRLEAAYSSGQPYGKLDFFTGKFARLKTPSGRAETDIAAAVPASDAVNMLRQSA
jgi:hypothetical protein